MKLGKLLLSRHPTLKKDLRIARIKKDPEEFLKSTFKNSIFMAFGLTVLLFFYIDKSGGSLAGLPLYFIILSYLLFKFNLLKVRSAIYKRRKEIDKDVLFAGRYLLVKLNSGQPLINALMDASKSYGVASKYFKEMIRDIELGKPIEQALTDASEYSPSEKFRRILFQISNALKIGIDVTEFLEATLNEIAEQQLIEINRYGKKLNSVTLFYMLFAVVLPSLGLTIFIVIASIASIDVNLGFFGVMLFFLALLQGLFITVYKGIRPNVNI